MNYPLRQLKSAEYPENIQALDKPPKELYLLGSLPPEGHRYITVVGSRNHTTYGSEACTSIIRGLAGYPVSIVSGLALGIDAIAHRAALRNNIHTIAVPGSGLLPEVLYPATNRGLASSILKAGGALLSPFTPETKAARWTFPVRNHVMAGIADAILVIEAGEKSGTLLTAEAALSYNRDVLAIPGSIFSAASAGTHRLLRDGAHLVTSSTDVLEILGLATTAPADPSLDLTEDEQKLYDLLSEPRGRSELIRLSGLDTATATRLLTALELKDIIHESMGQIQRIA